ncbi:MAG: hypothetical protein ABIU30_18430 [Ferruginibacter sp.]
MSKHENYVDEATAMEKTGYKRTSLYRLRKDGKIKWTSAKSGRKVKYYLPDLMALLGF